LDLLMFSECNNRAGLSDFNFGRKD